MIRLAPHALLLVTGLLLSACASTDDRASGTADAGSDPAAALRHGMSAAQVETLLGRPSEVRHPSPDANLEVWVYRRVIASHVRAIAPTVTETPWVDPITGEMKSITDPTPGEERTDLIEELSVYMMRGTLADVRRSAFRQRHFDSS